MNVPEPGISPPAVDSDATTGHGQGAQPTRAAPAVPTQHRIGPFTIVRTLGQGGMGLVYLARDERDGKEVALKVIPAGADADQNDLARFRSEGEAVKRLDHPNIVKYYEVGQADDLAYLSMEYVNGGTLYRRLVKGGPIEFRDAARLVEQIARAIHYAHEQGVVHRDLKPSNILLAGSADRDDADLRRPKLADFGLVKLLDSARRLTSSGVAVGTPHYMAPEQARGETNVGPPLDIHGLGAILYELLTGQPPFQGATPAEMMEQVVHKKPKPPSAQRYGVPQALEAICLKCLEKDPQRRYPTARLLADDLQRYLDHPSDTTRFQPVSLEAAPVRRARLWHIAASIAIVGLAVALTWLLAAKGYRERVAKVESDARQAQRQQQRAAERAALEAAIAQCEQGLIAVGLERLKSLPADSELPVASVIDAWTGSQPRLLPGQPSAPTFVVAAQRAGARVATANGAVIAIWRTDDWSAEGADWLVEADVNSLAWSPDGSELAVGTKNGRILIGNVTSRQWTEAKIEQPRWPITALNHVDGSLKYLLTTGDAVLRTVGAATADAVPGSDMSGPIAAAAIDPVFGGLVAIRPNGAVRIFDPQALRWRDMPPDGHASAAAYSPDGNAVAIGTRAGTVRLWDAVARVPLTEALALGGEPIATVAVAQRGGDYFIVAGLERGGSAAFVCARPWFAAPIRLDKLPGEEVLRVSFSTTGSELFVTSPTGIAQYQLLDIAGEPDSRRPIWDHNYLPANRHSKWYGTPRKFMSAAAPPAPGAGVVVGGERGLLYQVNPKEDLNSSLSQMTNGADVTGVATGPAGQICALGRTAGATLVRQWSSGLNAAHDGEGVVNAVVRAEAFMPTGTTVVLGCDDGTVRFWNLSAAREEKDAYKTGAPVTSVAVSQSGLIAAGCRDGTAHIWGPAGQITVRHRSEVRGVAFHGDKLLTASADGTSRRWDSHSGLPLGPALQHPDAISTLAVWGPMAATGGRERYVRVWRLP